MPGGYRINWAQLHRINIQAMDNLQDASDYLRDEVRMTISTMGPPRSSPGQPPHVDTTRLLASYDSQVDRPGLRAAVFSTEDHSIWLEQGTVKMQPRPHLVATLLRHQDPIARILCRS